MLSQAEVEAAKEYAAMELKAKCGSDLSRAASGEFDKVDSITDLVREYGAQEREGTGGQRVVEKESRAFRPQRRHLPRDEDAGIDSKDPKYGALAFGEINAFLRHDLRHSKSAP